MLPAFRWQLHEWQKTAEGEGAITWRELYDNHLKKHGVRHKLDRPLAYPPGSELLQAYWDLSAGRTAGFAPNPITWSDIDAYCRITGARLHAIHIDMLRAMDEVRIREAGNRIPKKQEDKVRRR